MRRIQRALGPSPPEPPSPLELPSKLSELWAWLQRCGVGVARRRVLAAKLHSVCLAVRARAISAVAAGARRVRTVDSGLDETMHVPDDADVVSFAQADAEGGVVSPVHWLSCAQVVPDWESVLCGWAKFGGCKHYTIFPSDVDYVFKVLRKCRGFMRGYGPLLRQWV